jgi:OFA family oxalate/formate antiporter-like MFS transporter
VLVTAASLVLFARGQPYLFLPCAAAIGFCYGSNFAIYPATVSRLWGSHLLGSIYSIIMAAQGVSSLAPAVAGFLNDRTGSFVPGLAL